MQKRTVLRAPPPTSQPSSAPTRGPISASTPQQALDWDDLRFVLAVGDGGSLNAGATRLGVRHSTVLRRLDALEARLGTRLFERHRRGYSPTEAGELMVAQAARMAPDIEALRRQILGRDVQLSGSVRLNCAFVAMQYLLPGPLASFARLHPGITVELREAAGLVDLTRRDADVALRLSSQVPDFWIGRQVAEIDFRAYALAGAAHLPQAVQALVRLCQQAPWIGFEQGQDARFFERWMNTHVPAQRVVFRLDLFHAMVAMLHTGLGVGLLPCFVGEREPRLVAVSEKIAALRTPLWLLSHPDLRGTARVARFVQHLADGLAHALTNAASTSNAANNATTAPVVNKPRRSPRAGS